MHQVRCDLPGVPGSLWLLPSGRAWASRRAGAFISQNANPGFRVQLAVVLRLIRRLIVERLR
jgi:hypothetical protein